VDHSAHKSGKLEMPCQSAILVGKKWVRADRKGTHICAQTHRISFILEVITNQFQEKSKVHFIVKLTMISK